MPLTSAQYQSLATDITVTNSVEFAAAVAASDDQIIANAYNVLATPDYWVRRTLVTKDEYVNSTSVDGTIFTYVGNGMITRATGEQFAWSDMFDNPQKAVNPSRPQVIQAFADIFSGTGNGAANLTHVRAVSRRKATRIEKLLAGTPGTGTTANPATMTFEGALTYLDIAHALRGVPVG